MPCSPTRAPSRCGTQGARIRELAEQLDAHRKARQALHPALTLTDLHNVLEKERAGEPLSEAERRIHEQGLVTLLRQLHDALDAAVADAYGWPADLPDEELLERLVALNAKRAAEEKQGLVRWLRPAYQAPDEVAAQGAWAELAAEEGEEEAPVLLPWPESLPQQVTALRALLAALPGPATPPQRARAFQGGRTPQRVARIEELLATLVALGHAEATAAGYLGG